ncbi:hypothetical protein HPB50_002490 [Hyalomma asiaticum]|uniref:Uncharacterized protein n=1 Tax=Hyalomma asiaticum TaxID=266040 RepID=A0ACB7SPA8_HYAAI|nr:hypothetical protein HPB50_002490 [Hyalomma asiaticum]
MPCADFLARSLLKEHSLDKNLRSAAEQKGTSSGSRRCKREKALSCPNERDFLLKFLRARKYNVDAAFANIRKYFKVREEVVEIFGDFCPSGVLYDARRWNMSVCTPHEFVKICLLLLEWSLLDEEVQKRDFVFVLDYIGLTLEHLYHLTPPFMKKLVHITEKCLPVRVKAIYVIYDSLIFDVLFAITKPFMSRTLTERIHLIGCEHQKLHGVVPADVIPEEAGGTLESYDYNELEKDLLSQSQYFEYIGLHGYGKENTEF